MRPQFFHNTGRGRFVELFADRIGDFFERKYLGRGLARLDWNGDGRMDYVVSNIAQRASLVTNLTENPGHYLNIRLTARTTARDAIGAIVDVETPKGRWRKQLTAGDGYMASNQRILQFGLADEATIEVIRIFWPSGEQTVLRDVPVDRTMHIIEGLTSQGGE